MNQYRAGGSGYGCKRVPEKRHQLHRPRPGYLGWIGREGVAFNLSLTNSNAVPTLNYSAMTGTNSGNISFLALPGSYYALNVGQDLFHQYDVAYDLQGGIIAFQPISVPEPSSYALGILSALALVVICRRKTF